MWNQGDYANEGGFMAGSTDSPSSGKEKGKSKFAQNLIPTTIKQLLDCEEEPFKIDDLEGTVVSIVGLVKSVDTSSTKTSYQIYDQTGSIEVLSYIGNDQANNEQTVLTEGTYAKIIGSLRVQKQSKYVIIFRAKQLTDLNELTTHLLEVAQIPLKMKKLKELESTAGEGDFNKMNITGGGNNATLNTSTNDSGVPVKGFNLCQETVFKFIHARKSEAGTGKDEILEGLGGRFQTKDICTAIDFLSAEGHIFSTVDDDHYASTDW